MQKKEEKAVFDLSMTTIILAIAMLIIPIVFFILLNSETGSGFGFKQIFFSITIAILATLFLVWIKKFMINRPYLGLIVGLSVLIIIEYSLFIRFRGPYTIIFAIISSLVTLIYLLVFFLRYRTNSIKRKVEEFDESN